MNSALLPQNVRGAGKGKHSMSLRSFQYFLVAVEEMNFRTPHAACNHAAVLSAHFKKLEDVRGAPVRPPPAASAHPRGGADGRLRHPHAAGGKPDERRADDLVRNKIGRLVVGMSRTATSVFMPLIWERYHKQYPNIDIIHVEGLSDRLLELLQQRRSTCASALAISAAQPRPLSGWRPTVIYCIISKKLLQNRLGDDGWSLWRPTGTASTSHGDQDFPF
jgi:DNA-binding transcriptional LysR family regulator